MTDTVTSNRETLGFQTEVKQLLQLMIHSLYSNREIFLRELVSNASDACDKLRFEGLHNATLFESDSELAIRIAYDKAARTLTISDNGIGMSRDEVINNLGTIAKSGTREFFSRLSGDQQKDANLIGQFGVGFYSAFIVADKVTVVTRRAGEQTDQGVRWESDGGGEFSIEMVEKVGRGTELTLHLRADQDDLLSGYKLREIVRKYSNHIVQPILMEKEEWKDGAQHLTEEDETINQALRYGQSRKMKSLTSNIKSSTNMWGMITMNHWRGVMRVLKVVRNIRNCCISPSTRPLICGIATRVMV